MITFPIYGKIKCSKPQTSIYRVVLKKKKKRPGTSYASYGSKAWHWRLVRCSSLPKQYLTISHIWINYNNSPTSKKLARSRTISIIYTDLFFANGTVSASLFFWRGKSTHFGSSAGRSMRESPQQWRGIGVKVQGKILDTLPKNMLLGI